MYKMKADGVVFYDSSSNDMALQVLSPKAKFELNKADTLEFTMLPGNVAYDSLQKMKTIVTLEDDGEVIFRGRVLGTKTDLYNQKEVYCEGEMGYLYDSIVRPYEYEGKANELFRQLVAEHNSQMESHKQFQVGIITAVTDEDISKTESEAYCTTFAEIRQMLINPFGGYLRVRMSGGVRYLDYLDEYMEEDGAPISFGVNLIDIEDEYEAGEVFSVLVPLGGYNSDTKNPTTIAEVNGGLEYIESASAIAKYGRIVKTYKWEDLTDPQEILEKGQEHIAKMEEERTLVIKAFDLHDLGQGNRIRLGSNVFLDSSPHGLNGKDICSKLELDIESPDQSEYTFGIPPETLTDNNASVAKKVQEGSNELSKLKDWLTVTDTELKLQKQWISENGDIISNVLFEMDAMNATILLKADQTVVSELETRVSNAEILIDGANAAIDLKADRTTVSDIETRMSAAEILIDGANAAIELKAAQSVVDAQGERLSAAELRIDGAESKIEAKADLILLDGYVKADELETSVLAVLQYADLSQADLDVGYLDASSAQIATLDTSSITTDSLSVGGSTLATASLTMGSVSKTIWSPSDVDLSHSHSVTVNGDGTITLGEVATTGGTFNIADTKYYKDGVSAAKTEGRNSVTLTSLGWQGGRNTVEASNGKSLAVELPPFSVTGGDTFVNNKTTVYFNTPSVSGYLKSKEVDASKLVEEAASKVTMTAGPWAEGVCIVSASNDKTLTVNPPEIVIAVTAFDESRTATVMASGAGRILKWMSLDASDVYNEGYEVGYAAGYQAAKDAVVVTAGISWSNPQQYYAMVRYWGRAMIDGEEVGYASGSESKNVSGYV
jgi:hypothetical protein